KEECIRLDIRRGAEPRQQLLAQAEEATKIGVGFRPARDDDDAGDTMRMIDRENLGGGSAGRVTDDMRLGNAERVEQRHRIGGEALDHVTRAFEIALPDTAMIIGDRGVAAREARHLIAPEARIAGKPSDEEHGKAIAFALVIKLAIADRYPR